MLQAINFKVSNKLTFTPEEKSFVGRHGINNNLNGKELAAKFKLPIRTAQRYLSDAVKGVTYHSSVGRPPLLNEFDKVLLKDLLSPEHPYQMPHTDFVVRVSQMAQNNKRARSDSFFIPTLPSKRSIKRVKDELGVKTANAEIKTQARSRELASKSNVIAYAALLGAVTPLVPPELVLNTDATQFGTGTLMKEKEKVVYTGPRPTEGFKIAHREGDRQQSQIISIKWYTTLSAGGFGWHPVYIIQDDEMDAEDIDVQEVTGLGYVPMADNKGYVVFCKSRAGLNERFYKWHCKEILVPFVTFVRKVNSFSVSTPAYHQLDGEQNQIVAYTDESTVSILQANNIIQGKQNPSKTETEQPCDAGSVFKANKGTLKAVKDEDVQMDVELLKKLDAAFVKHRTDMRAKISDYVGLPFPVTKNAKWGLLKIRYAHMQTMTSRLVTDGFKKVGMVPYCIDTIINNCTTKFTEAEYHQLIDALPRLVKIVRQRGQLTWADYLSVGIDLLDDVDKDAVSLAHKRCVILTNPNVIAELAAAREAKAVAEEAAEARRLANKAKREAAKQRKQLREAENASLVTPPASNQVYNTATELMLNIRMMRG